jgi:hypothetical protein
MYWTKLISIKLKDEQKSNYKQNLKIWTSPNMNKIKFILNFKNIILKWTQFHIWTIFNTWTNLKYKTKSHII